MINSDFDFLPGLVKQGFSIIMDIYSSAFSVDYKDKGLKDPVTLADKYADELYIREISRLFPHTHILTEESYAQDLSVPSSFWCIDPLDGTKDFVLRNGEFCTMIAYIENNTPVAGIIGIPVTGQMFLAEKSKGTFLVEGNKMTRIYLDQKPKPMKNMIAVHSRNHQNHLLHKALDRLGISPENRFAKGSVGNKVAHILLRKANLYLHPSRHTKWWDSAAGDIVLHEAGGSFTDLFNKKIKYYGNCVYNRHGVVASSLKDNDFLNDLADLLSDF